MAWLWIVQFFVDLTLASLAFALWKQVRTKPELDTTEWTSSLDVLHSRAVQWEKDALAYRRRMEEQLRYLSDVCEQAQAILLRNTENGRPLTPSAEETELKSLRDNSLGLCRQAGSIPSVQELEIRKLELRPEIPMDLRSLLRDQLT